MGARDRQRMLKAARRRAGVNLRVLAKVTGVDFSMLARYERGEVAMTPELFTKIIDSIPAAIEQAKRDKQEKRELKAATAKLVALARESMKSGLKAAFFPSPEDSDIGNLIRSGNDPYTTVIGVSVAERKRQLAELENLKSVEDPIVAELIESFRREIASKDAQIESLTKVLEEK